MAFKHKLVHQLAPLGGTIAAALLLAACGKEVVPVTAPQGPDPVPVASVTVSPATASVTVGQTVQLTATPRDAAGNPLSGRAVAWVSSATRVATVSGSGLVAGVAAGTATITASSEGQSGTAAVTVSGAAWPNEPVGFRVLNDWGFDQSPPAVTNAPIPGSPGWMIGDNDSGAMSLASRIQRHRSRRPMSISSFSQSALRAPDIRRGTCTPVFRHRRRCMWVFGGSPRTHGRDTRAT